LGSAYKDAPALGWLTITFLIFVIFIGRAIKQPLSFYLERRSSDIARAIEEGRKAKLLGQEQLALYDQKLKSLTAEIEKMKALFRDQAIREKEEKLRLAKEMESRIIRNTDDTIRANFARAKIRLADEVIALAIAKAQKSLADNNQEQMDQLLRKQLFSDLKHAHEVN
jgi:F0F1-type ATP synthase membrane subunit b/b'